VLALIETERSLDDDLNLATPDLETALNAVSLAILITSKNQFHNPYYLSWFELDSNSSLIKWYIY